MQAVLGLLSMIVGAVALIRVRHQRFALCLVVLFIVSWVGHLGFSIANFINDERNTTFTRLAKNLCLFFVALGYGNSSVLASRYFLTTVALVHPKNQKLAYALVVFLIITFFATDITL